tara:strand:- start:206 stop:436 length:231 start_codon:yes stop_codon:yes gene_type:complete
MGRTKEQLYCDAKHAWGMFEMLLPECTTLGDAQEQAHWLITDNGLDGYITRKEIDDTASELYSQRLKKILGASNGG